MSIFTRCGEAARLILAQPERVDPARYGGVEGLFTEVDVTLLAARLDDGWDESEFTEASHEASQVMGGLFRNRKVVRYGIVKLPGVPEPDYVRARSKIIYASPDGPEKIETPNGTFHRLWVHEDPMSRSGRRAGSARTDFIPWQDQEGVLPVPAYEIVKKATTAEHREIIRLNAENAALRRQLEDLERECSRLREHRAIATEELAEAVASKLNRRRVSRAA